MKKSVKTASAGKLLVPAETPSERGASSLHQDSAAAGSGTQPAPPAGVLPAPAGSESATTNTSAEQGQDAGGPVSTEAGSLPGSDARPSLDGTASPSGTITPESDQNGEAGNSAGLADRGEQLGGDDASSFVIFEASQGDAAEGTGANAGPVFTLDDVLVAAAAANVAQLLNYADIGKRFDALLQRYSVDAREWLELAEAGAIMAPPLPRGSSGDVSEDTDERRNTGGVVVKSARDGFRRAGLVLSRTARTFGPGELTAGQVAALADDPAITIEYL